MTALKHTPGPWQAHHDHGWLVVESDNGDLYVKIEKGSAACKHMANARLIAAAPVLLQALRSIAEESTDPGAVECAKEAIAKATRGAA